MAQLAISIVMATTLLVQLAPDDHREAAFRGKRIAEANCGSCHALAQIDESTLSDAPPFRDLAETYRLEELRAMLRDDVFLRHAVMPDFEPTEAQAGDLAIYIHSLSATP